MSSFLSPNQELLHWNSHTNKWLSPLPTLTKRTEKEMELLLYYLHISCIVPGTSDILFSLILTTTILQGGIIPITQMREKMEAHTEMELV